MPRLLLGALLGLPLAACPAAAAEPAKTDLGANAALKYWLAFAALPRRDRDQEQLLQAWQTAPLDEAARKLVDGAQETLSYLHSGARLRPCDWSLDYDRGPGLLAHHLNRALTTARLAGLRARLKFQAGDRAGAVEDLADSLALARHLTSDRLLVTTVFVTAVERPAAEVLAAHLAELDAPLLARLAARLDALPPGAALSEALLLEKKVNLGWFVRQARAIPVDEKGEWKQKVARLLFAMSTGRAEAEVRKALRKLGEPTPDRLAERLAELGATYDEAAKLVALPRPQFEPRYAALMAKARAANPLAGLDGALKGLGGIYDRYATSRTRLELLRAAVAAARGGPDKVKDFRDPSGEGPFEYRARPGGFEVRAKRTALIVGPAKK